MPCPLKFLELLQGPLPSRESFEDNFETALYVRTEKEQLPIDKIAYIIFPWQVVRTLHIKEAGFVSDILLSIFQETQCMYE